MALFASMAAWRRLTYRTGRRPAVADLVAGRIALSMANLTTAQPHIRAGRLRSRSAHASARRFRADDLSRVLGYEATNWNGIVAGPRRARSSSARREIAGVLAGALLDAGAAGLEPIGDTPPVRALPQPRRESGESSKAAQIRPEDQSVPTCRA
jgi:hypothetical protein